MHYALCIMNFIKVANCVIEQWLTFVSCDVFEYILFVTLSVTHFTDNQTIL